MIWTRSGGLDHPPGECLGGAALLKLTSPRSSAAALTTFGLAEARLRWTAWATLIGAELTLAVGVGAGSDLAAYLAAALMALFGLLIIAPCCEDGQAHPAPGSAPVPRSAGRRLGATSCSQPRSRPYRCFPSSALSTDPRLGLGLAVALLACAGLAVAVLALAREVGMLRLRLGPQSALEIPEGGPPLGERVDLAQGFEAGARIELLLATFTAAGCHVCHAIEPALAVPGLGPDPLAGGLR